MPGMAMPGAAPRGEEDGTANVGGGASRRALLQQPHFHSTGKGTGLTSKEGSSEEPFKFSN